MPTLQPLPLLAALTPFTGEMRLGTNMLILPLRHPIATAEEFSTLDHLSGGRAIAGVGLGYRENEFAEFGVPMTERLGRFNESVDIMRKLWTGDRVSHEGKYFRFTDEKISLPPVQPGGPPVWIGAGGKPKAVERPPGRRPDHPAARHSRAAARVARPVPRGEAGQRTSRAPGARGTPRHPARRGRRVRLATGHCCPGGLSAEYGRYNRPDDTADYQHLAGADEAEQRARAAYLFTDPSTAILKLKDIEAAGITTVILRVQWFDLPQDRVLHSLELFAQRVLPAFQER